MVRRRRQSIARARSALFWALLFFAGLQFLAAVAVEQYLPEARDPEYTRKAERLKARLREAPGCPLVLMLGSSRTSLGLRAAEIHVTWDGAPAVVFNFGISGGGPILETLCLRRLLRDGIRPDLLLVEILPPLLNQPGRHPLEEVWLQGGRMRLAEIRGVERYHGEPSRLVRRWCWSRLTAWSALQWSVQPWLTPDAPEPPLLARETRPGAIDGHGWEPHFQLGITAEQRRHLLEITRAQYRESMGAFRLAAQPVQALHDLVGRCRSEGIAVAFVLMPEGTLFRALYPSSLRAGLDASIARLSREVNVPLIDARDWVPDEDLWDAHHPLPSGAAIFTARLTQEALRPLLDALPRQPRPAYARERTARQAY